MTRLKIEEDMKAIEEISRLAPELNPSNYDHDQVCLLNTAMCEIYGIAREYGNATAEVVRDGDKPTAQPCVLADAIEAVKRGAYKAKRQRDNWKARALKLEAMLRDGDMAWEVAGCNSVQGGIRDARSKAILDYRARLLAKIDEDKEKQ